MTLLTAKITRPILLRSSHEIKSNQIKSDQIQNVVYIPVSHRGPVYIAMQEQIYPSTWSVQVPPFKQGLLEHSLISL